MLNQNNSFIISCFRQFYQHLLLEKSHIMKHTYVEQYSEKTHHAENQDSEGSVSDLAHSEPNKLVEQVTTSLERLFDQQLEGAHDQGGQVLGSYYKKAQFVMVALADEVFLKLDWLERETWEDNLLEIKFFNTRHAGTAIFDQIKTLIKEKSDR